MFLTGPKLLVTYAGGLTARVAVAVLSSFKSQSPNPTFDAITAQRINTAEPDGTLRVVLTNNNRIPGLVIIRIRC